MVPIAQSGIWECFYPGMKTGELYKFAVPAQIVRVNGEKVRHYADEVDQTSVENPTLKRLDELTRRVEELEKQLKEAKEQAS